jgi:hypothetical protein
MVGDLIMWSALAAPDEYAAIWRHCFTLQEDCLKALQKWLDHLPDNREGKLGGDLLDTLRRALTDVEDGSMRWWRVLSSAEGVTH